MKKILFPLFVFLLLANFSLSSSSLAQEATDSADKITSDPTEQDSQDIDSIRQAVKDKVKEKIDQIISKPNQKLGWVGQIVQIESGKISIDCLYKQTRHVLIDEDTIIINTKRQTVEADQLKIDQIVLAMGYIDIKGNLLAKRILITNEPLENLKNAIVLATVTDISQTTTVMTLVTKDRQVFQVKTDKTTKDIVKNQKIITILKSEGQDSNNWQIVDFKVLTPVTTPTQTESE